MANGPARWVWQTLLAGANLLLWVGIACLMGLCAGDRLDLGLETLVRQGQATAVAAWDRAVVSGPTPIATRRPPVSPITPAWAAAVAAGGPTPDATPPAAIATMTLEAGAPVPTAMDEPDVELPVGTQTAAEASLPATAEAPAVAKIEQPLLLADPPIRNLASLNAESERSAPGRAVQIRYQQDTLNREIAALWQNNPDLPFREVQIDLHPNQVVMSGRTTVLGFQVEATVTGIVLAHDCRPHLEIQSLSLSGTLAPRLVYDEVEKLVLESMAWYPAGYPLCLEQIVLEEGRLTAYGSYR